MNQGYSYREKTNSVKTKIGIGTIILLAALLPPFLRKDLLFLCLSIIVFGIYSMSWDLVYGYTGLLSCGHAIFFGVGAYGMYYAWNLVGLSVWLCMLLTLFLVALLAIFIGYVANLIRESGFIIITLILTLIFYYLSMDWRALTGGEDGLIFLGPDLFIPFIGKIGLSSSLIVQYYFLLFMLLFSYWALRKIVNSSVGLIFQGIRENETRMQFLGYNTHFYKVVSFGVSGIFAGIAGILFIITQAYVSIFVFKASVSFDAIIYVLFGGAGTLIGSLLGVGILYTLKYFISDYFRLYQIVPAILVVLIILFRPQGFVDIFRVTTFSNLFQKIRKGG